MHRLIWIGWNVNERRLRAGWRVVIYTILWVFTPDLFLLAGKRLTFWLLQQDKLEKFSSDILHALLTLLAVLIMTWLVVRWLDRRTMASLGLRFHRQWWLDFGFGLWLGAFLMTLIFVVEWWAGWIVITDVLHVTTSLPFAIAILGPLFIFLVISITEELLTRGYQLRNLAEGLHGSFTPKTAVLLSWLISSIIFGLIHLFNPHASWISTVILSLIGAFWGLGYVLTQSLAMPIGCHLTWNFFLGNVYGFPVSGNVFPAATFVAIEQRGPVLWTGGAFGPEAGLLCLFALAIGVPLTVLWVYHQYGMIRIQTKIAIYEMVKKNSRKELRGNRI
ncbi:MAG: CPBP family intramembrane glutamic endopeptidase [Chloroflexota bacterium]